jgi:hypothetical protein
MRNETRAYVMNGAAVGGFLRCLFENDLMGTFNNADEVNLRRMREWVVFIYNYTPAQCHGSKEIVAKWQKAGGLLGLGMEAASHA